MKVEHGQSAEGQPEQGSQSFHLVEKLREVTELDLRLFAPAAGSMFSNECSGMCRKYICYSLPKGHFLQIYF